MRRFSARPLDNVPTFKEFLRQGRKAVASSSISAVEGLPKLRFFIETYGCQMNTADSEIVRSILNNDGHESCDDINSADLILTNTCAIRENAENKVFHRLKFFESLRRKNTKIRRQGYPLVGVLGCMAERLKEKLLEVDSVDFVCGPDAYRDIPRLLHTAACTDQKEANTLLSIEETYADITPVRESASGLSAFVSIMRGCNNMCSFCIVPFTRGRERSRDMSSILSEVRALSEGGAKEVLLLGQNVNGYHDSSPESSELFPSSQYAATPGFSNIYNGRSRQKPGARFADLLRAVAEINPDMRVRFTSPHPKDFPDEVLQVVAEVPNVCNSLHVPLQSGSSSTLTRMRRGYSREAFLQLIRRVREIIPGVSISTDIISGFCGETEAEHEETLSVMREARFDQAFMFAYSLREKTHAARTLEDDVPEDVKLRRLKEIIDMQHQLLHDKNVAEELGRVRLVLVEGPAKKSFVGGVAMLTGRTDGNKRVVFPAIEHLSALTSQCDDSTVAEALARHTALRLDVWANRGIGGRSDSDSSSKTAEERGDQSELCGKYVAVYIAVVTGPTLRGYALGVSNIQAFTKATHSGGVSSIASPFLEAGVKMWTI